MRTILCEAIFTLQRIEAFDEDDLVGSLMLDVMPPLPGCVYDWHSWSVNVTSSVTYTKGWSSE